MTPRSGITQWVPVPPTAHACPVATAATALGLLVFSETTPASTHKVHCLLLGTHLHTLFQAQTCAHETGLISTTWPGSPPTWKEGDGNPSRLPHAPSPSKEGGGSPNFQSESKLLLLHSLPFSGIFPQQIFSEQLLWVSAVNRGGGRRQP